MRSLISIKKIKDFIAGISFKIFLWSIKMTREEYWREVAKDEGVSVRERIYLKKANDLLRSAYQISERQGKDTNCEAFKIQTGRLLSLMHSYDLEKSKGQQVPEMRGDDKTAL